MLAQRSELDGGRSTQAFDDKRSTSGVLRACVDFVPAQRSEVEIVGVRKAAGFSIVPPCST